MAETGATKDERRMEPIDSLIILLLACTLVLFLLWLAGAVAHSSNVLQLPDFITQAYSKIWAYIVGLGGSTVLSLLRGGKTRRPNYIVWSLGTSVVLLLLAGLLSFGMKEPANPTSSLVLLKFRAKFDKQPHPNVSFLQRNPHFREARPIGPNPSDGHYQEYVDWPAAKGDQFEAEAVQVGNPTEQVDGPDQKMKFCFTSNINKPKNGPPFEVYMQCALDAACTFAPDDYGWASECPKKTVQSGAPFRLIPDAYALDATESAPRPGWRVASLATLQRIPDDKRAGYTRFNLRSDPQPSLAKANAFRYQISANSSPLYVDGWSAADMLKEYDPTKGLNFSFGLENLNFSGADRGCENIELSLEFLNGDNSVKTVKLGRRYAALRDAVTEQIKTLEGMQFLWTGSYVKPRGEDRAEVFVLSTTDLNEASRVRRQISQAHLSYNGMEMVGVLRPPLNKPLYGVVIGLRQPTGQVKFTFDLATAKQMRAWAADIYPTNKKAIPHSPSIYVMKTEESGTGRLASCGTGGAPLS